MPAPLFLGPQGESLTARFVLGLRCEQPALFLGPQGESLIARFVLVLRHGQPARPRVAGKAYEKWLKTL